MLNEPKILVGKCEGIRPHLISDAELKVIIKLILIYWIYLTQHKAQLKQGNGPLAFVK
jgi:hypothetical protein